MKKIVIIFILLLLGCSTYKPFKSYADKKKAVKLIKTTFNINKSSMNILSVYDSALYEINESISKDVKFQTTNRRIDSFLKGSYNKEQFLLILNLDQLKDGEFDFDYSDQFEGRRLNFKSIEAYKKFNMDSLIEKELGIKKRDSIIKSERKEN